MGKNTIGVNGSFDQMPSLLFLLLDGDSLKKISLYFAAFGELWNFI